MSEINPLQNKIRAIKIYVRLPSGGRYNKDGIDFTNNGSEVPVRAMTAKDELLLRNPDALLNGDAVEKLVQSCVPEIHNIRETPMNDVDAILLAIKYATYGDKFEYETKCPKCGTPNKVEKSIRAMLDGASDVPEFNSIKVDSDVEIFLKPYSFESSNRANIVDFDSQKRINYIQSTYQNIDAQDPVQIENAEKIARTEMSNLLEGMADFSLGLMLDSVIQVNLTNKVEGQEPIKISVTNKDHIKEYIWSLDPETVELIKAKMKDVMKYGVDKNTHIKCVNESCDKEWDMEVGFDQANFFGRTSRP